MRSPARSHRTTPPAPTITLRREQPVADCRPEVRPLAPWLVLVNPSLMPTVFLPSPGTVVARRV